jgi:hypothetical protein
VAMKKIFERIGFAGAVALAAGVFCLSQEAKGEALLQYFNQSHAEIAAKIPELAEAGYSAIWIPPPTKANGGMSVGYDLFDPFDIGNTPLRGQYATRYGTETDLLHLIEVAHRFGIRVYFDNVMNHRAYDVPGYDENTPADVYPGMVAEDFHLRVTSDGYYRKWDNIDWGNFTEWDVMYRPLSDLIDIAHESGDNGNFGTNMGDHHAKPVFVRHPNNPEFYDRMPHPSLKPSDVTPDDAWNWNPGNGRNLYVGFGGRGEITDELIQDYPEFFAKYGTNGVTKEMLADYPNFYKEDVGGYLCRAVRWLVNKTHVDGLRLDAVKHVPYYFFGATGDGKDYDPAGYIGNAQWQFDRTRGFRDTHYRDSVFDIEHPRDDLMIFGEHLGAPPAQGPYIDAGMRLVDDDLRNQLNWRFGANELWGYHVPGAGGFGPSLGVMHAQSHDNDYADRKQLQHAYYYMRTGLGLVYTDGNNRAATLSGSGGAFPRWACTDFLGQWGESQIPTLLSVHENFAIGPDWGVKNDEGNHIVWQRGTASDGSGDGAWTRLLVMFNSLWDTYHTIWTAGTFPQTGGSDDDTYLYNYASSYGPYMTHFKGEGWFDAPYAWASQLAGGAVEMPGNSYALWAIKNPDPSDLWSVEKKGLSPVISLCENGEMAPWTLVDRVDGVDGDPAFNPNNVDDDDPTDFTYSMPIPVVKGTNVTIKVRSDGSAKELRLRLDGGMDFGNGIQHNHEGCPYDGDDRDSPPGCANDWDLGFENCDDAGWFTLRIWPEKFAAPDVDNCHIGSAGAVSYQVTGGVPSNGTSDAVNGAGTGHGEVDWVFHDATGTTQPVPLEGGTPTTTTKTYTLKASVAGSDGGADGFGAWDTSRFSGNAWYFAGYQASQCGITGFEGDQAYGLYCNPADGGGYASLSRPILHGDGLKRISVDVGMLWDSNIQGRYKGVEFQDAQGNAIFGVQMEGCPAGCPGVNYYGTGISGTWSESYGSAVSSITLTRTATGYSVTGTNRNGVAKSGISVTTDADIASFRAYMDPTDDSANRQLYFDNLTYTAEVTEAPVTEGTAPQFSATAAGATVWAKTSIENNTRMRLYYTVDGNTWPEGAAGEPANRTTMVVPGTWKTNSTGQDAGSWWRFDLPAAAGQAALNGTLRYKLSAFRQQGEDGNGYDTVKPHKGADAIAKKKRMLTEWTIPNLNLKTLSFNKHNDHNSPTTGFAEGFHLVTARVYADHDGAPVPNTFRQTFYVDAELPRGQIEYPAAEGDWVDGSEYGVVVRTDDTVDDVWYWIDDINDSNDGIGNGRTTNSVSTNVVAWGRADRVMPWTTNMATDMALPKVWRFTYRGIAGGQSNATIYVRLRECSSAKTNAWSADGPVGEDTDALHVKQLTRTVVANGENHYLYFDWPMQRDDMVEYGWKLRLKHDWSFARNLGDADAKALFTVKFESPDGNGGTNETVVAGTSDLVHYQWNHPWDNELFIDMPNIYTGDESDTHFVTVTGQRTIDSQDVTLVATNSIRTRGPVQPTCIITTPPETDSDGVKYVIEMPDLPASVLATNAQSRVTPIVVQTDRAVTNLQLAFTSPSGFVPQLSNPTVATNGTALLWNYDWTVVAPGSYTFTATVWADTNLNTNLDLATNFAVRNATIQFRQQSDTSNAEDLDWDDDGISNTNEMTQVALPASNDEQWKQEQVFAHFSSGRTDEKSPDTDGDGLPDGLELGVRWAVDGTDWDADTNGDGWKNFLSDCDPPFYNTRDNVEIVDGISNMGSGADRTVIMIGTVTDPRNADTDYDGLPDGIEDANRNGWVDGDGVALAWNEDQKKSRRAPNGIVDGDDVWKETSPGVADSDRDGLSDGYGEDTNYNGRVDIFLKAQNGTLTELLVSTNTAYRIGDEHSRAVNYTALFADYAVNGRNDGAKQNDGWPRLVILETDPLCTDTDNDGLPDGWETRYGLDPLDNGVYNFRTGEAGNEANGPDGNPDGDQIYNDDAQLVDYTNERELASGTNPVVPDSPENPGGSGSIVVGDGAEIGKVNDTVYRREFLDWSLDDLLALDDYNRGGNSADIFRWGDGFDSSRDIVAFYVHDGGQEGVEGADGRKGDGRLYFRVDFDDLQANAEYGSLDIYVAINVGQYGQGEYCLPDQVNAGTEMRWNALVAVYDSATGALYVDKDKDNNTTTSWGDLPGNGVVALDGGFGGAHFNSQLDAVMWSIPRKALEDLKWAGDIDKLMFQVYTTRDGTQDAGGPGDKGGRNDFTDVVGDWKDDWICSDYGNDYTSVANHGYITHCIGRNTGDSRVFNHCGRHAKLALVAHGNQAIEPGLTIQNIVDNGQGAGYGRPVKIHNIYTNCPLNLHITPTLALALQWAEVGTSNTWFSGPALNDAIRAGVASGGLALLGSTYSDHIPRYFSDDFNAENVAMATATLNEIYGDGRDVVSTNVFWSPERVVDSAWMLKVRDLGYQATLVDQTPHLLDWFGRERRDWYVGTEAYKIQNFWIDTTGAGNFVNVKAFALSTAANDFRYVNTDEGLALDLRRLFLRRARGGDSVISSIFYMWEDFASSDNANAYDKSLRWIANHPWIQVVTLDEVLGDESLLSRSIDVDQATAPLSQEAQDWVHHACNENYDNWYFGNDERGLESLAGKAFEIRQGETMEAVYGTATNGILKDAWTAVAGITNAQVKKLAEATIFASAFETAFHNEGNNDLSRWSYGDYIYPALDPTNLMSMAWRAQSRTRLAAVYAEVDDWAGRTTGLQAYPKDIDLDGEREWILRNDKVMAVFEAEGGVMIGAWLKDGTDVWQMVGNFAAQPETGYETQSPREDSQRGTAMKDIVVNGESRTSTKFGVTAGTGSLTFSTGGNLSKTVRLADAATGAFEVSYTGLSGSATNYVRNGLSPDLATLMATGQRCLTESVEGNTSVAVTATKDGRAVTASVRATAGHINTAANDKQEEWNTVDMRNVAHVRQVEVMGTGSLAYTLEFTADGDAPESDSDGDGMPDWWETEHGLDPNSAEDDDGADGDPDDDGFKNLYEYWAGTIPTGETGKNQYIGWESAADATNGWALTFQCVSGAWYAVEGTDSGSLVLGADWQPLGGGFMATNAHHTWVDTNRVFTNRFYRLRIPSIR